MRAGGMQEDEIFEALLRVSSNRCDPPLPEAEVHRIAESVGRYPPGSDIRLTDMGNARRLAMRHGDDLRYCYPWHSWVVWDGRCWKRDETGEVVRRAKETAKAIRDEAQFTPDDNLSKAILKWAHGSQHRARIGALIHLAQSELAIRPEKFDSHPWLLNVQNGTLDLLTGEIREPQRQGFLTQMANVSFDAAATCPRWSKFLDRIFDGNAELIRYVQGIAGYCMTGDTQEQEFYVLYGKGANGKSTFIELLLYLLGDYAKKSEASTLLAKTHDPIRNDIASLRGSRLVAATEVEHERRLNEPLIKELTGGDKIRARFLYQEHFEFVPQFKLLLATNYKPEIRGVDEGIWRRVRMIPFSVTIPALERDKSLLGKLKEETSGILNWALKGIDIWRSEGLTMPEVVKAATDDYRGEMDIIGDFMDANIKVEEEGFAPAGKLYKAYLDWCGDNGEKAVTQRTLGGLMRDRGFKSVVKRIGATPTRGYPGLTVLTLIF